ncbi:hypothetical protein SLA2020_415040 [Shorea laevis]
MRSSSSGAIWPRLTRDGDSSSSGGGSSCHSVADQLVGECPPPALTFLLDVISQKFVLLRRPRPSLQPHLAAARRRLARRRPRPRPPPAFADGDDDDDGFLMSFASLSLKSLSPDRNVVLFCLYGCVCMGDDEMGVPLCEYVF